MYARSTTVNGDPKSLDGAIAYVRDEVMPIGPGDGRLYRPVDAVRPRQRPDHHHVRLGDRGGDAQQRGTRSTTCARALAEMMGGRPEVQEWEIAVLHRAAPRTGRRLLPGHLEPR